MNRDDYRSSLQQRYAEAIALDHIIPLTINRNPQMTREIVPTPRLIAQHCVNSILIDLQDRRDLSAAWNRIDDDTQQEIIKEWEDIIIVELGSKLGDD